MDLKEMLFELSEFYPIKGKDEKEDKKKIINRYHDLIKGYILNKDYNWDKVLTNIQINRKYSTFPTVHDIIENLPQFEKKKEYIADKDEGAVLVVELPSGYKYQFEVSNVAKKNFSQLKAELHRRFGDFKLKKYPKGTVIIGDTVFEPD